MNLEKLLEEKREEILQIASRHGALNLRVFGSVSRGESGKDSDLDFLATTKHLTLLGHVALIQDLEELLGCKVDVVSDTALHWYIRDRILEDARPL